MTYSFSNLKKSKGSLDKLSKAIENLSEKNSGNDDRFWYPETDKAGNGSAIIRFLPSSAVDGEEGLPWVRTFSHGFQGPGGWLIENCLTTLKQTRKLFASVSASSFSSLTFLSFLIPRIQTMKVRFFSSSLVRRSLTRLQKQ